MVGTEYAPALSPRRDVVELPGAHGSLPLWRDPLSEITVNLVVRVLRGASQDTLRQRWNTLINLLGTGTNQPIQLTRIRGEHEDTAEAQLLTTNAPPFDASQPWLEIQIVLTIPAGVWGSDFIEQDLDLDEDEQDSDIGLASSMPVSDLMIRVAGPLSTITIEDNVSGTGFEWGGNVVVPASGYLIIDSRTMRAYIRDNDDWEASGTDVSGTLAFTGYGPLTLTARTTGEGKETSLSVSSSGTAGGSALTIRAMPATA